MTKALFYSRVREVIRCVLAWGKWVGRSL